jgi:hypothetical protein
MVFLALLGKIISLQEETLNAENAPFCTHLSSAVFHLLKQSDEGQSVQPYWPAMHITVALLKGSANQEKLRVTICGQQARSATQVLLTALAEQPVLRCQHQSYQVLSVDLARPPLASVSSWADLLVPSSSPSLGLRFVTPVIFAGIAEGSLQGEVFPQPLQVFSALLGRWNVLQGPALTHQVIPWLQRGECVVSDYRLQAEPIALHTGTGSVAVYPGWKGRITFTCRTSQIAYMSTLWTLARLACFTGVGDYTEIGLGVTQIMENE